MLFFWRISFMMFLSTPYSCQPYLTTSCCSCYCWIFLWYYIDCVQLNHFKVSLFHSHLVWCCIVFCFPCYIDPDKLWWVISSFGFDCQFNLWFINVHSSYSYAFSQLFLSCYLYYAKEFNILALMLVWMFFLFGKYWFNRSDC